MTTTETDTGVVAPVLDSTGQPTIAGWRKMTAALKQPLPSKTRTGPKGRALEYITARDVQNRLDLVAPGAWHTVYRVLSQEPWVVECRLTVFGVTRCDVGYSNSPDADDEIEPAKAAYSDALKRAAVAFGVGRWLYQ